MQHFSVFLRTKIFQPKRLLLLITGYCLGLLLFAVVLVQVVNLVPCPLCIVQRFFFGLVALVAFIGYMEWWPKFHVRLAGLAISFFAFLGWLVAARHVYLQVTYIEMSASSRCLVSFGSFLDDVLVALGGTGNCAVIDWKLLGLSIPQWSLMAFTLLMFLGGWIAWKKDTQESRRAQEE